MPVVIKAMHRLFSQECKTCQRARLSQLVARDPAGFPTLDRVGRIAVEFDHQGVLVENGEPEKAAEEAHKTLLDIWAKYKDSCRDRADDRRADQRRRRA